ncbi:hypothetical protein VaNZ11_010964 [Volvox africanus]|uniref:FO synthase n=1 Tax=Volvox africanus TaxID=51714 RepID=A0ABQ5SAL6_9CHLO|nr:hypothetical protein VaNZ11_010964 [Volvox africanus]
MAMYYPSASFTCQPVSPLTQLPKPANLPRVREHRAFNSKCHQAAWYPSRAHHVRIRAAAAAEPCAARTHTNTPATKAAKPFGRLCGLSCRTNAVALGHATVRRACTSAMYTANAEQPTPIPVMAEVLDQYGWMLGSPLEELMSRAAVLRDNGQHGAIVSFSPKVFLPITRLCRDMCGYCTFAQPPRPARRAFMTLEEILQIAAQGAAAGCSEALLTLGDKPEDRWPEAASELMDMGFGSTIEYVEAAAKAILRETGLLPHINAGVMSELDLRKLKKVSASQGLMLESTSLELMHSGGAHHNCPDKDPASRLKTIEAAGRAAVPYTSGILVGIGDTRSDRLHALACLHRLNERYGHIQELIIQNFRAKPATAMATWPEPPLEELLWAVTAARIMFGPNMNIQAPPNLTPLESAAGGSSGASSLAALQVGWRALLDAGINDWGGISPITRDFVNPDKPWPHLSSLAAATAAAGKLLLPRLPVYPAFLGLRGGAPQPNRHPDEETAAAVRGELAARAPGTPLAAAPAEVAAAGNPLGQLSCRWLDFSGGQDSVGAAVLRSIDSEGFLRASAWVAGRPDVDEQEVLSQGQQERAQPSGVSIISTAFSVSHTPPPPAASPWPLAAAASMTIATTMEEAAIPTTPAATTAEMGSMAATAQRGSMPIPRWREGRVWRVAVSVDGALEGMPRPTDPSPRVTSLLEGVLARGRPLQRDELELLLRSRGADYDAVCAAADELRRRTCGDTVSYVVNRNINYTNVCTYKCSFCAFSKGRTAEELRGPAYVVPYEEIARRTAEAWDRGATEVCMQGGIHPNFTGDTYLRIVSAAKAAAPAVHVHAFSPLEVHHGATSLGLTYERYLERLAVAGLGSLPGTAAEVLHDHVRSVLCPDKIDTATWLKVVGAAHRVGLCTTSTLMFGSVEEGPAAWASHLVLLRELQQQAEATAGHGSGVGITEFVPLPFVHMESPVYIKGQARRGPSLHEIVLLHAVARLALHPHVNNVQASWVKVGPSRAAQLLAAGCNDMGGSIMNESITRAAGAAHGQELPPVRMEEIIRAAGRQPRQRTTLYGMPPVEQTARSYGTVPLQPLVFAAPTVGGLR